jgi:undecaprenyl diphosphate synthase
VTALSEALKSGPRHVAIIMDGNGRWAAQRGLQRSAGHRQGVEALRTTVRAAADRGIRFLTVYSFSTENWSRPKAEVSFLMELFRRFIHQDVAELHASGVRVRMIGNRENIDAATVRMIEESERLTKGNTGLQLIVAFNYGSRQEIVGATRRLLDKQKHGEIASTNITEEDFANNLDTHGVPDPDLLVRTGGEKRISNFLLWQCAYTELIFVPEYWPEFNAESLDRCIREFNGRERRFGGVTSQTA